MSQNPFPPHRTSDLFHGSREFVINGSELNNVAGNMTHRTEQAFYFPIHTLSSTDNTTSTVSPTVEPAAIEQKDSDRYARLLWPKGRGYPLWSPNPNKNLSPEYVENGVGIGDVGIITSDGDFDFLFNICLPSDHPINGNRVPEGFIPIPKPDPVDLSSDTEQFPGAFLMSKSMRGKTGTQTMPPLGVEGDYYFQCSHYEGAILILPEGSFKEDLRNLNVFRQYAIQNGESWYRYANGPRGREAVNGSIHLVTGYDKGTSWVLGAFEHCATTTGIIDLQFSGTRAVNNTCNDSSDENYTYHWSHSGPARIKYGPTPVPTVMNQCLFARTFLIELNSSLWTVLFGKGITVQVIPNTNMKSQNIISKSSYVPFGIGNSSFFSRSQRSGQGSSKNTDNIDVHDDEMNVMAISTFDNPSDIMHPSRMITRYLLHKVPKSSVAIAHHNDWKWLLSEGEETVPDFEELSRRLEQLTLTEVNDGVFLTFDEEPITSKTKKMKQVSNSENDAILTPLDGLLDPLDTHSGGAMHGAKHEGRIVSVTILESGDIKYESKAAPIIVKSSLREYYTGNILLHIGGSSVQTKMDICKKLFLIVCELHNQGIIHGSICAANVNLNMRIVTLENAGLYSEIQRQVEPPLLPCTHYRSAEELERDVYIPSEDSDLYALTVLIYAIFSGKEPYGELDTSQRVVRIARVGHTGLLKLKNIPSYLWSALETYWNASPAYRKDAFVQIQAALA